MKDTPPDMERKYREMLLQRSGAERLKMGCSMFATARALVIASMREKEPAASPARVREGLFLQFYGTDFAADERGRITAWLARDEEERPASMAPRRAPVDWDDPGS